MLKFKEYKNIYKIEMDSSDNTSKKRSQPEEPEQMNSEDILAIVKDIYDYNGKSKEKQRVFRKKYPEFAENFPVLFEMSTKDDFDYNRLRYMIHLRDNIQTAKISQHDASAKVGQMLYDVYVKDKIKDIPPTK